MEPILTMFEKGGLGKVRVVTRESGFWFVAMDVARCIGHSDTSRMCDLCRDSDCYTVTKLESEGLSDSNSHVRSLTLVSEPGLYRILAKCRLPKCEPFERWVFEEVLPAVREHGVYATPSAVEGMSNEELMAKAVLAAQETISRLRRERDAAVQEKSRISAGREATLMNRCGNQEKKIISLTKENETLKSENTELREKCGTMGWQVKDIPWIREIFLPMPKNGEFRINVYNRIGTLMPRVGDSIGVHLTDADKVVDRTSGHRVCVWPQRVVEELKRHLDTRTLSDPYVEYMKAYFKPAILREILNNKTKDET